MGEWKARCRSVSSPALRHGLEEAAAKSAACSVISELLLKWGFEQFKTAGRRARATGIPAALISYRSTRDLQMFGRILCR